MGDTEDLSHRSSGSDLPRCALLPGSPAHDLLHRRALISLCWAFALLLVIMFVFSVFFVHGAADYLAFENPNPEVVRDLEEWYSSLPLCIFSLLLCISGGNDWWAILSPLTKVNEIYR